jgi:hypothetical protein
MTLLSPLEVALRRWRTGHALVSKIENRKANP